MQATLALAITLETGLASIANNRTGFESAFKEDVGRLFGVQPARVTITAITGGSNVVSCEVSGAAGTGRIQQGHNLGGYSVAAIVETASDSGSRLIIDNCTEGHTGGLSLRAFV